MAPPQPGLTATGSTVTPGCSLRIMASLLLGQHTLSWLRTTSPRLYDWQQYSRYYDQMSAPCWGWVSLTWNQLIKVKWHGEHCLVDFLWENLFLLRSYLGLINMLRYFNIYWLLKSPLRRSWYGDVVGLRELYFALVPWVLSSFLDPLEHQPRGCRGISTVDLSYSKDGLKKDVMVRHRLMETG